MIYGLTIVVKQWGYRATGTRNETERAIDERMIDGLRETEMHEDTGNFEDPDT